MKADLAGLVPAQSVFHSQVKQPPTSPNSSGLRVIKEAKSNRKLAKGGRAFTRGQFKGLPLFALTLEERATCPTSCDHWLDCYGNGMFRATRYAHGPALEAAIKADVAHLAAKHPAGFVVRLHVLGDFYSVAYVRLWQQLLTKYPALRIYGYTHREHGTPIGDAVTRLVTFNPGRVSILRSDGKGGDDPLPAATTVAPGAPAPQGYVNCPEQRKQTASCLTCGLCMNGRTQVAFDNHGRTPHSLIKLGRGRGAA